MDLIKRYENGLILEHNNKNVIGLDIGVTGKGIAKTEFSDIRRDNGYIYRDGEVVEFNLPEISELDGNVIIYSNELSTGLNPLFNSDNDFKTISTIIDFVLKIAEHNRKNINYSTKLLYRTDAGELLMMPPSVVEFINEREPLAQKLSNQSIYRHPELKSERNFLFSMGILLYEHATDNYPIEYNDVEDLRDKMRRGSFIKPEWNNPDLSPELCSFIMNLLDSKSNPELVPSATVLKDLLNSGFHRIDKLSDSQINSFEKSKQSLLRYEKVRGFITKNRGTLIAVGAVVLSLGALGIGLASSWTKPPITAGYTRNEVVEAYFKAYTELDPMLIDDVLDKKIAKESGSSNEVATHYVTQKMRMQSMEDTTMLTPDKWLLLSDEEKAGRDAYGMRNVEIEQLNENSFSVSYEKWFSMGEENNETMEFVQAIYVSKREEIFTLEETKHSFKIIDIETISEETEQIW